MKCYSKKGVSYLAGITAKLKRARSQSHKYIYKSLGRRTHNSPHHTHTHPYGYNVSLQEA